MPIGDILASITGEPSPTTTSFLPALKRKASDGLRGPIDKTQRTGSQAANSSRPIDPSRRPSTIDANKSVLSGSKPSISSPASTALKNGHPTPPPSSDAPKPPPKKGSFAEILARGKLAQSTLGPVGKIQHKKIEKLPSRRAREAVKAQKGKSIEKGMAPNSKFQRMGQSSVVDGKNVVKQNGKGAPALPEKKIKKAATATTGYAGTARPKSGGQTASRPRPASTARGGYRNDRHGSRYDRYLSEDEEDDEMEEVEEEDYESDASSDMEAAVFEVDEEEERATRLARKEDAEALAEENRHKREKEEKKRRLMAMAKKAGARSY